MILDMDSSNILIAGSTCVVNRTASVTRCPGTLNSYPIPNVPGNTFNLSYGTRGYAAGDVVDGESFMLLSQSASPSLAADICVVKNQTYMFRCLNDGILGLAVPALSAGTCA